MLTDLSRHHRQPEIMDAPELPPARFAKTLKSLERVNAVTLAPRRSATRRRLCDGRRARGQAPRQRRLLRVRRQLR
jgi:hypothetical protein